MDLLVLTPPEPARAAAAVGALVPGSALHELPAGTDAGTADGARLARGLTSTEDLLERDRPAALVLCGYGPDVAAAALVAAKLGVPQARLGAGLRGAGGHGSAAIDHSIADRLCELLLCEEEGALEALGREGLGERARLVGHAADDPEPAAAAIRAWARSYTSSA